MAAHRVGVVGAGLAGLAAAVDLAEAGCRVTLFERSRLLGGRATSFCVNGCEVDNGQHVFLGCYAEFLGFVRRLGLGEHVRLQERFDVLVLSRAGARSRLRSARLPAPWHLVSSFVRYRHLGWRAKFDVARALVRAREARAWDGTCAQWLAHLGQGEEALRAFWRPFLVPALNAPLDRMSAADAGFVLETAFLRDPRAARLGYLAVPLARLAEAAASRLGDVRLQTPVSGVDLSPDRAAKIVLAGGAVMEFDGVIAAVSPPQLSSLLASHRGNGLPAVTGYTARPIIDVHLWHDRGGLGFDLAALLDSPVQWVFEKAAGYLCCSLSAADALIARPSDELVALCWDEVRRAVPALAGATLLGGAATRSPEGTFTAAPGVAKLGPRTGSRRLVLAGSWTDTGWPDTLESAVRSGRRAARQMLDGLEDAA